MEDCIFCRIAARQAPARIVLETEDVVAFEDIHPQAPVHELVIPKKHIVNPNHAVDADETLLGKLMLAARDVARLKGIAESGFRTVINNNRGAGQSVFHVHVHVLGGRRMPWPP
jgi:histidine triad (HIT) family protein